MRRSTLPAATAYAAVTTGVILVAVFGYVVFRLVQAVPAPAEGGALLLLAAAAGLASLFSPCSFPLLVTVLARAREERSIDGPVPTAAAFSMGVLLFLGLTGVAISLGGGWLIGQITFASTAGRALRLVVGLTLILFGLWQVRGRSMHLAWLNRALAPLWDSQYRHRHRHTLLGDGLYGFGYILAGFG